MQACGVQRKLGKLLVKKVKSDEYIEGVIPQVYNGPNGTKMETFVGLPMHQINLGCKKTQIPLTVSILSGKLENQVAKDA